MRSGQTFYALFFLQVLLIPSKALEYGMHNTEVQAALMIDVFIGAF
jgi:hypothetical protein